MFISVRCQSSEQWKCGLGNISELHHRTYDGITACLCGWRFVALNSLFLSQVRSHWRNTPFIYSTLKFYWFLLHCIVLKVIIMTWSHSTTWRKIKEKTVSCKCILGRGNRLLLFTVCNFGKFFTFSSVPSLSERLNNAHSAVERLTKRSDSRPYARGSNS